MKAATWVKIAAILQILTGLIHSIALFAGLKGSNESEQQLIDLMNSSKMAVGPGFSPTMGDMVTGLSSCFTMLYLFGGILNWYLVGKKTGAPAMKGVLGINVLFFGLSFAIMYVFTFLAPVICTGLVFVALLIAWLAYPKNG